VSVDVTELAQEAGFCLSVILVSTLPHTKCLTSVTARINSQVTLQAAVVGCLECLWFFQKSIRVLQFENKTPR
jgi:hypothetical protein